MEQIEFETAVEPTCKPKSRRRPKTGKKKKLPTQMMLEKNKQKTTELQLQRESARTHVSNRASAYTLGSASMYRSI
jgi:hypothetical protein